jgi:hypothetical protein
MNNDKNKRYNIAATVRKAIHAQAMLGHGDVMCSAILSRRGKRLNSVDRSPKENFTRLMHQYIQSEAPDKMRVELRSSNDALLWTKHFSFDQDHLAGTNHLDFQGFGEAQLGELLNQKIAELRKQEELEELRSETEQLTQENESLRQQLEALEEAVEAKKKVEYYANILGLAFPGLAKMLSTTPLGGTLGALAGLDTSEAQPSNSEKTQRETIIELVGEFMGTLDDQALGQLYLLFIELSNNPSLIGTLLSKLNEPNDKNSAL